MDNSSKAFSNDLELPVISVTCLKKDIKPMMPLKTLDIINRRRYVRNTQYYFTNRKHAVKDTLVETKKTRSFHMPRSPQLLSYSRYKEKKRLHVKKYLSQKPVHMKYNLRFSGARNISSRLYIAEPNDDVRTVLDIHPEFYSVIEGRPIRNTDDIKAYIRTIRNYAMHRQQIGYRKDLMIQIEKNMSEEAKEHINISNVLKIHIHNFQTFLTKDYKLAQDLVAMAEVLEKRKLNANSTLLATSETLNALKNLIFKLDSIRHVLKNYRRYLYFVAPLPWRERYDEYITATSRLDFLNDADLPDFFDVDEVLEQTKIELQTPHDPHLYFKYPQEMLYIFRTMELQSREYLIQQSNTYLPYRMLGKKIKKLKKLTSLELEQFKYHIKYFSDAIDRELYNENYLKQKFYRILEDIFFESVAGPNTLKLRICINFVYEEIFGPSEEEFVNLRDPMRILEVLHEDYNMRLDSLHYEIVNKARNENFANDLKKLRAAHKAQKELKSFRLMTESLKRAFLPPAKFNRPSFKKIIKKPSAQALDEKSIQSKKFKVAPDELESLLFFTNWNETLNPEPYLKEYETYVKPVFKSSAQS